MRGKSLAKNPKRGIARHTSEASVGTLVLSADPRQRYEVLVRFVTERVRLEHVEQINASIQNVLQENGYLSGNVIDSKAETQEAPDSPMLSTIQAQLEGSGFPRAKEEQEAIRESVLEKSFRHRQDLLAGSYSAPAVAKLLHTSRQTPLNRAAKGDLLALYEKGKHLFPTWQFDPHAQDGVLPGLSQVLGALKASPIDQLYWFCHPSPYLEGRTPIQALQDGEVERVVSIARGVGE